NRLLELDRIGQNALAKQRAAAQVAQERDQRQAERRAEVSMKKLQSTLIKRAMGDPDSFDRALTRTIEQALQKSRLAKVELDVDSTKADAEIAALRARLERIRDMRIGVDIDGASAVSELMAIMQMARSLDNEDVDIKVDVDMGQAVAQLAAIDAATSSAARRQADLAGGFREGGGQASSAANAFRAMNGVLLAAAVFGPMLVPTLLAIAGALASIATMGLAAGAGIGAAVLGLSGIGEAMGAMEDLESEREYGRPQRQRQQTSQTRSSDRSVRNARRGVRDARESSERQLTQALRQQENAAR